jgi:hypothetical protein
MRCVVGETGTLHTRAAAKAHAIRPGLRDREHHQRPTEQRNVAQEVSHLVRAIGRIRQCPEVVHDGRHADEEQRDAREPDVRLDAGQDAKSISSSSSRFVLQTEDPDTSTTPET